jgi:hypothetical protein
VIGFILVGAYRVRILPPQPIFERSEKIKPLERFGLAFKCGAEAEQKPNRLAVRKRSFAGAKRAQRRPNQFSSVLMSIENNLPFSGYLL